MPDNNPIVEKQPDTPPGGGGQELEHLEKAISSPSTPEPPIDTVPMTWKTWLVIFILSSTFGLSFWPVPTTSSIQTKLASPLVFDSPQSVGWYVPAYTTANAIGFLLAGTNSDLFGRRIFLLLGNAICCVGYVITATAGMSSGQGGGAKHLISGLAVTGFGAGFCQMAMCAIPELMPNKFRHVGICISDGFVFLIVIIGPVVGRFAIDSGDGHWQYIYWGGFVAQFLSFCGLFAFYYPPQHPRGVPWRQAIRGLDYVGAALIVPGMCLALVGIINTTYKSSSDVTVIAPLAVGLGLVALFALWETFSSVEFPLCPPRIFKTHNGREFTVPFILAFIVTMFYYGINIIYPTMINVFYVVPGVTSRREELLLTLPGNVGLVFGAICLICFGNLFKHWKTTLTVSWIGMSIFGGLLAMVTPYNKGTMIAFTFLEQAFFGWAQYESIAFTQLGVKQVDLGISGGLSGVARFAGGSLAQAIYTSILTNTQVQRASVTVPRSAIAAGLDPQYADQLLAALSVGTSAIEKVPGINSQIVAAASDAFKWSYAHGLKMTAYSSLAFAGVGLICCLLCENIDHKMNDKTEIYLENDIHGDRNEFH